MILSKSSFKIYLTCPSYLWFHLNKPELLKPIALSDFDMMLAEQGKMVEKEFYKLFPETRFIVAKGGGSLNETEAAIQDRAVYIAQAGFKSEDFFAQSDLVHFKPDNHIDIYEIKSSSSMQNMGHEDSTQAPSKEEHIIDLTFQYEVATSSGYMVDKTFLVELNKNFTRNGEIDIRSLFNMTDVTTEVLAKIPSLRLQMSNALDQSNLSEQPITCNCRYLPRKRQCPAFEYMHPELSCYGVYDLANIGSSPKRLREFVDSHIFKMEDIPDGHELTNSYRDQVLTWNGNEEIILRDKITSLLDQLEFPLYFLDYETTGPAIPLFDGTRPYQHIPFQYSLHIIDEPGTEVRHLEFLHTDSISPMHALSERLRNDIGDTGSIIVWNKTFEKKCNENLAETIPALSEFLMNCNARLFDLMDIFSKKYYVHKDFKGSYSIKKVLPVLVPDLSYSSLEINDGGKATSQWGRMLFEDIDKNEKLKIKNQLLEYCKLDTLAMVEIYKVLLTIVNK